MKTFWINNQKFLLLCGGVLLTFLVASSLLSKLVEGANETYKDCEGLRKKITRLHRDLRRSYGPELNSAEAYEVHEASLEAEVGLLPPVELKGTKGLLIHFLSEIERTWGDVEKLANPRGLVLPEKLTAEEFGVEADNDGPAEYQRYYSDLDIVDRALRVLVEAGMATIGDPELIEELSTDVVADGEVVGTCLYRGVSFSVTGPYQSFITILQMVQEPKQFLQVRIVNLSPPKWKTSETAGMLSGELDFIGFRVSTGGDEPAEGSDSPGGFPFGDDEGDDEEADTK